MTRWFTRRAEWLASRDLIIRLFRLPITVNHVRYVKRPAIDPRDKALSMAKSMGRHDLIERLER